MNWRQAAVGGVGLRAWKLPGGINLPLELSKLLAVYACPGNSGQRTAGIDHLLFGFLVLSWHST